MYQIYQEYLGKILGHHLIQHPQHMKKFHGVIIVAKRMTRVITYLTEDNYEHME